ncbi:hypothetical protein [Halobacterium rubrum]|uniref:hypothetical protein n=1 Tax=Halobacterium TaxID=2239 RepID=UPI001F3CE306|nr:MULTISPECIES: hypothetical protein [Halobacterium]MDH5020084.1 hypothetical protein [Halobacterium rubrum]
MTRRLSRRGVLAAGGASALAALAGCSSVPFVGGGSDDDPLPEYDVADLAETIRTSRVETSAVYPAPVPESLVDAHRRRATDLLDSVPESPSFPNEAIQTAVRHEYEHAADRLSDTDDVDDPITLDDVGTWEHARDDAAAAAFAYRAASGEFDAADAARWRRRVEDDYRTERRARPYRGETVLDALAVAAELEERLETARRWLRPNESFPENPETAPREVGDVAADLERADAGVATVRGLREARPDDGLSDHWGAIAGAAGELDDVYHETVDEVAPYLEGDPEPGEIFDSDVSNATAAHDLFEAAVPHPDIERAEAALARSNYATAVREYTRALLGSLVVARSADAIQAGEHGTPPDVATVRNTRQTAVDAVHSLESDRQSLLAEQLATGLRRHIDYRDRNLLSEHANDRSVVRAAGGYTYVAYAAEQVPAVADRVARELDANGE